LAQCARQRVSPFSISIIIIIFFIIIVGTDATVPHGTHSTSRRLGG
jgi:hypothetical protein